MKVSELIGAELDLWVAKVCGVDAVLSDPYPTGGRNAVTFYGRNHAGFLSGRSYCPSEHWSDGGPLLDKYHFWISDDDTGIVYASLMPHANGAIQEGRTTLQAVCRALVFSVYGDTAPDEEAAQ